MPTDLSTPTPTFRSRLAAGEQLLGVVVTLSDPSSAEIMAQAGFDFLWLDAEHSALDVSHLQSLAQAAGPAHCLARLPALDLAWVKKTLDSGLEGIIFPLVNTPEQAAQAATLTKYPPLGERSVGVARAQGYGLRTQEYLQSANGRICTVVQIEHILGVQNVEAILATPGVDAALIGPYDLSASLGLPGQVDEPPVRAAIQRVLEASHAAGKPVGVFTGSLEAGEKALAQGFDLVAVGIDSLLLAQAAARIVSRLRPLSRRAAA